MFTQAAARTLAASVDTGTVCPRAELLRSGCTRSQLKARIAANRWQLIGTAVVLHNGELAREERWHVAVINCGPRAMLASFTATELLGLLGWRREETHVLAPAGVVAPVLPDLPIILHHARVTDLSIRGHTNRCQSISAALVLAARSFATPRPGCGVLAAGVQQRLTSPTNLAAALACTPHGRHQAALRAALGDIAMGAQALSEIDFVRLCRRAALPRPTQQAVRVEPDGRRRYLDAEWILPDGRRLAVEVDGAVHMAPGRWWDDQLRQNELTLSGTLVLRYPSVIVRTEPELVARQLRRILLIER